jgi:hypothetical protein
MSAPLLANHTTPIPDSGVNAVDSTGQGYFSLLQATPFSIPEGSDSGQVGAFTYTFSLAGACGFLQQLESRVSRSAVTIVSSSVFPSTARTRVQASYNLSRIFEKVRRVGIERSGFLGLNRNAYDRVVESMRDGEDYHFEFTSESPVDAAMASRWRDDLKRELLQRVLAATFEVTRDVNTPTIPEPGRLPFNRPVEVGGLGNVVMGIGPLGGYFSAARALIGSIEGQSSAEGSIRSSWNRMVTETWDYNRILPMISAVAVEVTPAR